MEALTALVFASGVAIAFMLALRRAYSQLVLANISEDLAAAEGIAVRRYNFLYLILIAVIVALGVRMVGGLLTAALVAIPPSAARNLARNLRQYAVVATAVGAGSAALGVVLSWATGFPAGPLIVLVSTGIFVPFAR
jgi:zinc transport system permease protein